MRSVTDSEDKVMWSVNIALKELEPQIEEAI